MSIIIITFENAPKVSQQALSKEAELDQALEVKTKGIVISLNAHIAIKENVPNFICRHECITSSSGRL